MHHDARLKKLEEHIIKEHRQSPVSAYLKEVIFGGIDGIITTFAVVAGFSGAALSAETTTQLSFLVVLLFGLANLFADAFSMGLGNYLSVRSDQSQYCSIRAKEITEIRTNPDIEAQETVTILIQNGFTEADAQTLTALYRKNENYWADFMMMHELKIPDPTDDNPAFTGIATGLSFMIFGTIPLLPFIIIGANGIEKLFFYATLSTVVALVLLGILKWKIVRTRFLPSVLEVLLVGGVAATIGFFVGSFFKI